MAEYTVEVTTGNRDYSGTFDFIFLTLFGSDGQSDKIQLNFFAVVNDSVSCTFFL